MHLGKKGSGKENSSAKISNYNYMKCTYNREQKENPNDLIIIWTTELECFSNSTLYDLLYK